MPASEAHLLPRTGPATVLVVAGEPQSQALVAALLREGVIAVTAQSVGELAGLLQVYAHRAVAVVDVEASEFGPAALDLLHGSQLVPTLMLMSRASFSTFGARCFSPERLDELAFKPLNDDDEVVLRTKALLVRAGFSLPEAPTADSATAAAPRFVEGRSVVVFGTKGGVGNTTVAVNLAVTLCRSHGLRVLLVDGDLWFGDVVVLLNLPPHRSIFDLPERFDLASLQSVLVPHTSGVMALLSPPEPAMVEKLPEGVVPRAVALARQAFDVVVTDSGLSFDEANLQLLEGADLILLVTTPEVGAVRNAARFLGISHTIGFQRKVQLVLNRANTGVEVPALEQTLGCKVAATVVSDGRLVVQAANEGVPVVERDGQAEHQVTRDLHQVAALVIGRPVPEFRSKSRSLLPWMKRREA